MTAMGMVFTSSKILDRARRWPILRLLPDWRRPSQLEALCAERERLAGAYAAARRGVRCRSIKALGDDLAAVTRAILALETRK